MKNVLESKLQNVSLLQLFIHRFSSNSQLFPSEYIGTILEIGGKPWFHSLNSTQIEVAMIN